MKIAGIVIGLILILVGLGGIPRFVFQHVKEEDAGVLAGRATCLGCETFGGAWLVFWGTRGLVRDGKNPRVRRMQEAEDYDDAPPRRRRRNED